MFFISFYDFFQFFFYFHNKCTLSKHNGFHPPRLQKDPNLNGHAIGVGGQQSLEIANSHSLNYDNISITQDLQLIFMKTNNLTKPMFWCILE